eukprot:1064850-Heterocapsa_arctica.AAC.1
MFNQLPEIVTLRKNAPPTPDPADWVDSSDDAATHDDDHVSYSVNVDDEEEEEEDDGYDEMTVKMLCELAKTKGLTGYTRLKKLDLITLLKHKKTVDVPVGSDT